MTDRTQTDGRGDSYEDIWRTIRELVMLHSPSGVETELDGYLLNAFEAKGVRPWQDDAGNLVVKIPGRGDGVVAITAHKDEICAIVTRVGDDGRVFIRSLAGVYPWVYGEGVVDLLGDTGCVSGVLSFGSRHVSSLSPQHALQQQKQLRWEDAWVETKLSKEILVESGVRAGTRMVVGKHRKEPFRLGSHIASYTLDNKASLSVLLDLAGRLRNPSCDIFLVATANEELGGVGALHFTKNVQVDALIALEIFPVAPEYSIEENESPVIVTADAVSHYDEQLIRALQQVAIESSIPIQFGVASGFGSDGSHCGRVGHVPRAACLAFPTQNTHGYEIAHLGAIENCGLLLEHFCSGQIDVMSFISRK